MTTVLGPVRRVQAMGAIAKPRRTVRGGVLRGQSFAVATYDHVLVHLEFASGALGQLLSSFGTVDSRVTLQALMQHLPERDKRIIELRFVEELTQSQIAERLGMSQMQVSRLLARILQTLREWSASAAMAQAGRPAAASTT